VIALRTTPGTSFAAADLAAGTKTTSREEAIKAVGSYTAENGSLTLMRGLLLAVSALVVGAFFTVWTIQRSADLAVLRAIGASTFFLIRDALAQALIVLTVGGVVGTALAVGAGFLAQRSVPLVLNLGTTVTPLLTILAVGMVGAGLALRRITSVDPLTALGAAR
jgi:putative ABC transport system permease protein